MAAWRVCSKRTCLPLACRTTRKLNLSSSRLHFGQFWTVTLPPSRLDAFKPSTSPLCLPRQSGFEKVVGLLSLLISWFVLKSSPSPVHLPPLCSPVQFVAVAPSLVFFFIPVAFASGCTIYTLYSSTSSAARNRCEFFHFFARCKLPLDQILQPHWFCLSAGPVSAREHIQDVLLTVLSCELN
jgi:hypothetical protein